MHGMKNVKPSVGLLWVWQWSSQLHRRSVIHSNMAWHGLLFWDMMFLQRCWWRLCPVDLWRVTFRWNVVLSYWTVDPEDEGKLDSRQGEMSQRTWIFTNTALRISQPPTVVPKHRQQSTNRRCVKSQKSADLIYTASEAWNHTAVEVLCFLQSVCQKNAQTEDGRR
jgi:hypothetical protein